MKDAHFYLNKFYIYALCLMMTQFWIWIIESRCCTYLWFIEQNIRVRRKFLTHARLLNYESEIQIHILYFYVSSFIHKVQFPKIIGCIGWCKSCSVSSKATMDMEYRNQMLYLPLIHRINIRVRRKFLIHAARLLNYESEIHSHSLFLCVIVHP